MNRKHTLSIHVHRRASSERCSLSAVVSINGNRKDISLGISCPYKAYSKELRQIRAIPDYESAAIDNLRLQEAINNINRTIIEMELSSEDYSLETFLSLYDCHSNKQTIQKKDNKVLDVLDMFVRDQSVINSWSIATLKKFKVLNSRVSEYRASALINDINDDWIVNFMTYLSNGYTHTLKSGEVKHYFYRNSSLAKMLKNIRWFLRWAKKRGYYTGSSDCFTMDFKGGAECLDDIVYLTSNELHLLMDHKWQIGQQHLERVVDAFIFSCYCGLRYSDISSLRRYHIHDGQIFTTIDKTEVKVSIPLNKITTAILQKYQNWKDAEGRPFPVISNQKSNEYIKEAARICGIDSLVNEVYYIGNVRHEIPHKKCDVLSFHCARRTFITQALVLGIPDAVLIQLTGHTSTKMLKRYQGVVNDLKQKQISKFDDL